MIIIIEHNSLNWKVKDCGEMYLQMVVLVVLPLMLIYIKVVIN